MKCKKVISIVSMFLCLALLCCSTSAFASPVKEDDLSYPPENFTLDDYKVEYFEDGSKIEIITGTMNTAARSVVTIKNLRARYVDGSNNELCSFTLYGEFKTDTGECINAYCSTTTSGGAWRVENQKTWRDSKTAYGSFDFVKRLLGVKVKSISQEIHLNY